jgi:hypothetical protein
MIIITENNYKPLNQIQNQDIIFYPNIFDTKTNIILTGILESLEFDKKSEICFTGRLPLFLQYIKTDLEKITISSFNYCLVTKYNGNDIHLQTHSDEMTPLFFFGDSRKIEYNGKHFDIVGGSLIIEKEVNSILNNMIRDTKSKTSFSIIFKNIKPIPLGIPSTYPFIQTDLTCIYLNNKDREQFANTVKNSIKKIHCKNEISMDFNVIQKYIKINKLIGKGDWGNVCSAYSEKLIPSGTNFAIKMSRITKEDLLDPFSDSSSSWYEIFILKNILKKIILKNICPNLPLFIDTCLCNQYDFIFRKGNQSHPSVMIVTELGNGDMSEFLKCTSLSDDELYSALFQIMAALHSIQTNGQILNNDIKTKNILYYNVKKGGYWHYKIDNHDFYVPNYGKMFILNDFGVSTLYNPKFKIYKNKQQFLFNLGSRYGININETFSPINAEFEFIDNHLINTSNIKWPNNQMSKGATYKLNIKTNEVVTSNTILSTSQKSYLTKKGITTDPDNLNFFQHPTIIPPFEFYNDTQDVLRMFVGGKRSTQKGNHRLHNTVSEKVQNSIKPYLGTAENTKQKNFSYHTYHVLAGSFIKKFFTETHNFKIKPKGHKISSFDMTVN